MMKTKYFSVVIVLIVLFLGQRNAIAQTSNEAKAKFKTYLEFADLGNQINTLQKKINQEVTLIPSPEFTALKKKAIAVMKEMSFDVRPMPKYTLLIKKVGPPMQECIAVKPYLHVE